MTMGFVSEPEVKRFGEVESSVGFPSKLEEPDPSIESVALTFPVRGLPYSSNSLYPRSRKLGIRS
jgi:hypothetical protein